MSDRPNFSNNRSGNFVEWYAPMRAKFPTKYTEWPSHTIPKEQLQDPNIVGYHNSHPNNDDYRLLNEERYPPKNDVPKDYTDSGDSEGSWDATWETEPPKKKGFVPVGPLHQYPLFQKTAAEMRQDALIMKQAEREASMTTSPITTSPITTPKFIPRPEPSRSLPEDTQEVVGEGDIWRASQDIRIQPSDERSWDEFWEDDEYEPQPRSRKPREDVPKDYTDSGDSEGSWDAWMESETQAKRDAMSDGDWWRAQQNNAHAIKAPEGTTAVTYAEQEQKYHLKPSKPKYGTFWRHKSLPSIGLDYGWLKRNKDGVRDINPIEFKDGYWSDEYRYDTAVIRNEADLKKAVEAQDRYQINLRERSILMQEIASLENTVNNQTIDINDYNETLSTYELTSKIQDRNAQRRKIDAKKSALSVLEKDLSRDRTVMHTTRDKMADFFVRDGPLTSENRAFGYSLAAFLLGGVLIAKALDTAVDWNAFPTARAMSPLEGVFGASA